MNYVITYEDTRCETSNLSAARLITIALAEDLADAGFGRISVTTNGQRIITIIYDLTKDCYKFNRKDVNWREIDDAITYRFQQTEMDS